MEDRNYNRGAIRKISRHYVLQTTKVFYLLACPHNTVEHTLFCFVFIFEAVNNIRSWSPDGQFISSAHAFSGPNHVAMITARDSWRSVCDFVGHKLPIVVTRFNPVVSFLLLNEPYIPRLPFFISLDSRNIFSDAAGNNYGVCLIGGQDNIMSVWTTISSRPLVALNSCFKQSVLDVSLVISSSFCSFFSFSSLILSMHLGQRMGSASCVAPQVYSTTSSCSF